ncbi:BolA family protein [Candidatus Photodesmus blepharus]|uniref:BolA family protein n=1 Tax=Candidatus Photodesmus blepharonis TaxID=1179155 RepID=UPI0005546748|nr:BolA/IbaG family iron-sulfur metabolism protein [Candidatus Photodesmus blepharus]
MFQETIEEKLKRNLAPIELQVVDESHLHKVSGYESHFRLVVVSDQFANQQLVVRHRTINQILSDELANHIHALSIHAYTPEEWKSKKETVPCSSVCVNKQK